MSWVTAASLVLLATTTVAADPRRADEAAPMLGYARGAETACRLHSIELTPDDVGSAAPDVFTRLPSAAPARFGLNGRDVRAVDFDHLPGGARSRSEHRLTTEYRSLGVTMNGIRISDATWQGPASAPNATWHNTPQVFTFTVPVVAVGIVNTSPDQNVVQLWSGPNATGTLLLEFRDQDTTGSDSSVDRFVGGRVCGEATIGSMKIINSEGSDLELDELVFEVAPGRARRH
jgi:hypothetical protein